MADRRAPLAVLAVVVIVTALLVAACAGSEDRGASGDTEAVIDWVDAVQINGIQYVPVVERGAGRVTVPPDQRGQRHGEVSQRLSGNVTDPLYRIQDGDATSLREGTVLYEISGYAPGFRIVAEQEGRLLLYEVDSNPHATAGSDLLDVSGQVAFITVDSDVDLSEVVRIEDPDEVTRLVGLVTAAPVNHDPPPRADLRRFITFHLADGTKATRVFWLETGELGRGIMTPSEFGDAIRAAVEGSRRTTYP